MILVETLAIEVGTSIAKSILKCWLKDASIAADASSTIVDVLRGRVSDRLTQREAQRQFEIIGEKVGKALLPVFEAEGGGIAEESRVSVALAVAETLNTATSDVLARNNLVPSELAKQLLQSHPAYSYHFSDAEGRLYERIVSESCEYIVDIASQLPSFTVKIFAEVLAREGYLVSMAEKTLKEVQRMREELQPQVGAARFELEYRRAVVRNLDIVELFGAEVSAASRRYKLSVAYISLSLEQKLPPVVQHEGEGQILTEYATQQKPQIFEQVVSVNQALADTPYLFIQGDPGSGKTTLLQWIAVNSASKSFPPELASWNGTTPFYIRLRKHVPETSTADLELPAPEEFPRLVAPEVAGSMPLGWVHREFLDGRAILLIDGVDEIPASYREAVGTWIAKLVAAYTKIRVIVTSRPYAKIDLQGFTEAFLRPMELFDIEAFIDHWHAAVAEDIQVKEEQVQLQLQAKRLKETIQQNRDKRNLVTNPLLCAMLCALNHEQYQQLPSDRTALYEACCKLLVERRDMARRIFLTDYPAARLTYEEKSMLLEDLAYWFIRNGWSEATFQQVDEWFARKLARVQAPSKKVTGKDARIYFVERSGIIREPVAGTIDFAHRTFQEYLAAKALVYEGDIGILVQQARNDQWREVVLMASGLASKRVREELILRLIGQGETEKEYRSRLYLLAAACAQESVEQVGQNVKLQVERRLEALIPPRNLTDAKALVAAGELVVPYLHAQYKYSAEVAAACVYTLTQIANDAALEDYANDLSSNVIKGLFEGIEKFDNKEIYAQRLLSQFEETPLLFLSSLEGLQYLPHLTSLSLANLTRLMDLSPLASLPQLTSLSLEDLPGVPDLTPLASLPQLTSLSLGDLGDVKDLTPLASLRNLTRLKLNVSESEASFDPLIALEKLEYIELSGSFDQLAIPRNIRAIVHIMRQSQ